MFNNNYKNKKEITKTALAKHRRFNVIISVLFLIIIFILIIQFTYNYHIESNKSISYNVSKTVTSNSTQHKIVKQTIRSNKVNKKENKKVVYTSKEKTHKASINEYEVYETNVETTTTATTHSKDTTTTTTTANNTYFNVPTGNTSFFAYMDYNTITDVNSYQYKYQINYCYTDDMGLRRNQYGDYVIALGSYYGTEIGTRYNITLDNGTTFTAVLGDCKADIHTDAMNQYRSAGYSGEYQNVIEFIVDNNYLSNEVKSMGNIGAYDMFNCTGIVSIAKIN